MKVLLIDNYDSFTYNIAALVKQCHEVDLTLVKNDSISVSEAASYHKIILSPGPATPSESGNILEIIQALSPSHALLGICLGHQAIAQAFGATLTNEEIPFHGFQTNIQILNTSALFSEIPVPSFQAGLYHSWSVSPEQFPACLEITAVSKQEKIMALQHRAFRVFGIQFHPESYMSEYGIEVMKGFLSA